MANYQAALRSVTYSDTSDNPSGLTRTVSYQVDDGATANHASNTVTTTVTVAPVNDPAVISGNITGDAIEAGGASNGTPGTLATGLLTDTDVDNSANTFEADGGAGNSGYGNWAIDGSGRWTYTIDDSNAAVQALNDGEKLSDTFTVHTIDGTAQLVTVTIHGANDAAVIVVPHPAR